MVHKQCITNEWYTPRYILDRVRAYYGGEIPLDPATAKHNPTKAKKFYTVWDNGLSLDWTGDGVFVNPPYGEYFWLWCRKMSKAAQSGTTIIALLPCGARFSTRYFQQYVLHSADSVCFLKKRVAFRDVLGVRQRQNPYDSAIYGLNVDRTQFADAFGLLGECFHSL